MLRRPACVARTRGERCLDRLFNCPRTVPTDFYRIDAAFPRARFPSRLFGASSLFTRFPMRQPGCFKTSKAGILDRYGSSAWPNRSSLACPTVLSIMKGAMKRFALIGAIVALPSILFGRTLQTVTLDVQNMTCAVCPITVKKALERVSGVTDVKVDFDKKTASLSFDPDKADLAALTKATTDAGYPSSVHK